MGGTTLTEPRTNPAHLLRLHGTLFENMVFKPQPGWETERVAGPRPETGDGTYLVELLSADGKLLVSVSPQVVMSGPCFSAGDTRWADIVVYVPLHPESRELVFRRGVLELYRSEITAEPPELRIGKPTKLAKDRIRITWNATHTTPLTFQVLYLTDDGRAFPLAANVTESTFTADLRTFPGSRRGRIGVLATDGLRSAFERSGAFRVEEKPPRVWIQSPASGDILPPDQPVTLNGHALDVGALSLSDTGLQWLVDRKRVLEDSRLGMATLEPGPHEIVLRYAPNGRTLAEQAIQITVAERSAEQELYLESLREMMAPTQGAALTSPSENF